jgi:hypothetical protein
MNREVYNVIKSNPRIYDFFGTKAQGTRYLIGKWILQVRPGYFVFASLQATRGNGDVNVFLFLFVQREQYDNSRGSIDY